VKAALAPALALVLAAAAARADEPAPLAGVVEVVPLDIVPSAGKRIEAVDIDNRLGDVTVTGHDAPTATLTVVKRAPDGETMERLKVNLVLPGDDGVVRIGSAILLGAEARPVPAGSVRIDITLSVPRAARLLVKAWNGKVGVAGMRAGATLAANDGEITVRDVDGVVSTTNARGRQRLSDVQGAVSADNAFGELTLDEIGGESLAARVHDGAVTATRIRSRVVTIRTTFGHILFQGELLAGGRYDLRSYKGDVKVRFAGGAAVRIDAYSRGGGVESQLELADAGRPEAGRLTGTYGPARRKPAALEISSVVGTVSLGLMNE